MASRAVARLLAAVLVAATVGRSTGHAERRLSSQNQANYFASGWGKQGSGDETPLSRATAFLSADYEAFAFWWEPLEMCRKLALTGWVLLIDEKSELARVLMALLVAIASLVLRLTLKPLRRCVAS